jgi:hypothetical protein
VAGRILRTTPDQKVERRLTAAGYPFEYGHVDWCSTIEDGNTNVLTVLAQVVLRQRPTLGGAIEVDGLVSERHPDVINVVRGDARRVETWIGVETRQ